jgi:putative ABC transport system permease protein
MNAIRQIATVTALGFSTMRRRAWQSLVIIVGTATVVGVLLSMLSFATGIVVNYISTGNDDRAIVLSEGAQNEFGSTIPREALPTIMDAPGIMRDREGKPIASAELLTGVPSVKKRDGVAAVTFLRGFGSQGTAVRPEFSLLAGRMYRPGTHEMIAGIAGQERYVGLEIGSRIILPDGEWTIVGSFETDGDIIEGELVTDTETLMPVVRRAGYGSVIVRLESPDRFEAFKTALTGNPALDVTVERHVEYYRRLSSDMASFFAAFSYLIGGILAAGALFASLNTMHAAVSSRTREIALLRAIGYAGMPVAVSVLAEAILLAAIGAGIGAAVAWFFFDDMQHSLGANVFRLLVTPELVLIGLGWAIVIALLAGIFPAVRAARLPVATTLRAV